MGVLPIVARELRVALRRQRPVRRRLGVAAVAATGTFLFVLLADASGTGQASRQLHLMFCLAGFYMAMRAPQLTAGILAKERREQTLGLLFLSGLSGAEVFASKLLSAAAIAFTDLLAMFPVLALPFLMGGVSFPVFLATIVCLPNLLLFALTVSLLASALVEDDGAAALLAFALTLGLCAAPVAFYLGREFLFGTAPSPAWLLLSPAYGAWIVLARLAGGSAASFWYNAVVTLGWSALCLSLAALKLARSWRERAEPARDDSWLQRWRLWLHGGKTWREQVAKQWLGVNSIAWLAARDRKPQSTGCLVVGLLLATWSVGLLVWRSRWLSPTIILVTATLLNLSLRWLIHYTAAAALGSRRADGSYELLLSSPVAPGEIVWGTLEGLRVQFKGLCRMVFGLEVVMMLAGLPMRIWGGPALFVYLVCCGWLLVWAWRQANYARGPVLAMWAGLNSGRPAHATWRTLGLNSWVWIWMLFNLRHGLSGVNRFPTGSMVELIFAGFGGYVLVAYLLRPPQTLELIEQRLISEFREIVREPLPDPRDPRFKRWKVHERFPWGWGLVQQQLHERVARRLGRVRPMERI